MKKIKMEVKEETYDLIKFYSSTKYKLHLRFGNRRFNAICVRV